MAAFPATVGTGLISRNLNYTIQERQERAIKRGRSAFRAYGGERIRIRYCSDEESGMLVGDAKIEPTGSSCHLFDLERVF